MRHLFPATVIILCSLSPAWAEEEMFEDGIQALEEIVVEASRAGLTVLDMPVNTSILDQQDIRSSAIKTVDEILRQIPGFSMLRSADSIASSPTTGTVSLRGLGGSAASRTLVLLNGVPIHNPYSSEVYWARIPKHQIKRVEVVRGGGANAWGNLSLGGVINILTEKPREDGLDLTATIGYPKTVDLSISGSQVMDRWAFSGEASYFDTDGYMNIPDEQQGPIDDEVRKNYANLSGKVSYQFSDDGSIYFNGSLFEEERSGGSALDQDITQIWALGAGLKLNTADGSQWTASVFYDDSDLDDTAVRINGDRDDEQIRSVRLQPTSALGTGLVWSRQFSRGHTLTAGADYRWTDLTVNEFGRYLADNPSELKTTTGEQDMGGVFIQDVWEINDQWQANASVRYDYVTNHGSLVVTDLTTDTIDSTEIFDKNSENTVNPSLGIRFRAAEWVSFRAAAYKGFRAATMRELYRSSNVRGNAILVNNPELAPERLLGVEAGADFTFGNDVTLRATVFQNTVENLIQNITRGVAGDQPEVIEPCGLIDAGETCRELANVGEMQARGLELEADYHPTENWSFFLSYLYNDTEITEAPDNPQIVGNQIRQAPKNSFTARVRNSNQWFDTTLQGRYVGDRFEDDLNSLPVDEFFLLDLMFSKTISHSTELFLSIENLLDEEYDIRVSNDGSREIGRPRFVGLGVRFRH